jgi:hypothetical protein
MYQLHLDCYEISRTTTKVPMHKENSQSIAVLPYENEARLAVRLNLQVPLFIRSRDAQGEPFLELGKTLDISATGACIACPRPLNPGSVLTLTVPAPSLTSSPLVPAGMPPIQCKVTRQQEAGDVFVIGVEFTKSIG